MDLFRQPGRDPRERFARFPGSRWRARSRGNICRWKRIFRGVNPQRKAEAILAARSLPRIRVITVRAGPRLLRHFWAGICQACRARRGADSSLRASAGGGSWRPALAGAGLERGTAGRKPLPAIAVIGRSAAKPDLPAVNGSPRLRDEVVPSARHLNDRRMIAPAAQTVLLYPGRSSERDEFG
jgi:hypothetical protein